MSDEKQYLDIVAEALGIQDLPEIQEVHVTWSGKQVWARARLLANKLYVAELDGQMNGLEQAKEILNG